MRERKTKKKRQFRRDYYKPISKPEQLQALIDGQNRGMANDNQIAQHRDNETSRRTEGKPSRRKQPV